VTTRLSSVPTVRATLLAQLQARPGLAGVFVDIGSPVNALEDELVWIGDAVMQDTAPTLAPTLPRDERWLQEIIISVSHSGDDQVASEARAFVLYGEVRSAVLTDPRQSNTALWVLPAGFQLQSLADAERVETRITLQLDCRCRN